MAIYANIYADQGADFSADINVTDAAGNAADLTGYTARAQARRTYTSSTAFDFVATIPNAVSGTVRIEMQDSTTNSMKGRYVYDVEIVDSNGYVTRVIEGQMEVSPGVTR